MNADFWFEAVGWSAALILLATILQQVRKQWRSHDTAGVSSWLFIGQSFASLGFTIYSWHLKSWMFVFVNASLLVSALVGQGIYLRNRRREQRAAGRPAEKQTRREPKPTGASSAA